MARKRSDYICEKCGKQGFKRTNPEAVVHYDSKTGKRSTCYYKRLLLKRENEHIRSESEDKPRVGELIPPKKFWGKSRLYDKAEEIEHHFYRLGKHWKKIKNKIYQFPPNVELDTKCVKDLDIFEKRLLNPLEKLLIPHSDRRYTMPWTTRFKIQSDNFEHGPRAAGIMNSVKTGQHIFQMGKKPNQVLSVPIERELTSKQVKNNARKTMKMAREILSKDLVERALYNWSTKTEHKEIVGAPEQWMKEQKAKKS